MLKHFALKVYPLVLTIVIFLFSKSSISQISINELNAWNTNYTWPSGYSDWVELKNEGWSPVNVSGYFISDDRENPTKWMIPSGTTIPARGFLVIWLNGDDDPDKMEASFALESSGEYLSLTTSSLSLVEEVEFPELYKDESYGKASDGSWVHFSNPTREAENDYSSGYTLMSEPNISHGSGLFSAPINVELTSPEVGSIYYTLDGSVPNASSTLYTGPFTISTTSVLKVRAFATGKASVVVGASYVFGASHDLPVIFVTSPNERKIWVDQNVGKEDVDGRIRLEYYESNNGRKVLDQYTFFRESGKTSKNKPKLNGKFYHRNDEGEFNYCFFPNKKMKSKNGFLLRNTSQDLYTAHMRNALMSRIIGKDDVTDGFYFSGYQPAVLYTDGVYEGIIHISEDDDNMFFQNNFPDEDYTYVTRRDDGPNADIIGLNSLHYDFTNPADRADFESKKNIHDLLTSYHFIMYSQSTEVPQVVTGTIPGRVPSEVHFLYDCDNCFGGGLSGSRAFPSYNFTPYVSSVDFWEGRFPAFPDFPQNILDYEPYKLEAAQFSCAFHNFVINEDRVVGLIDEIANSYIGEMDASASALIHQRSILKDTDPESSYSNEAEWLLNVDTLKQFARKSNEGIFDWLKTTYGYSEYVDVQIETSGAEHGNVRVHGIKVVGDDQTGQFFKDIPLMVKAVPQPGYQFSHWEGDLSGSNINEEITFSSNGNIRAVFVPIPFVADDIMINEVQSVNDATVTDEAGEYNDWFEIYNKETYAVDLAGYYVSDDSCDIRKWQIRSTDAAKTTVDGESWLILWADKDTIQGPNHVDFKLNSSEHIILTYPDGVKRVDMVEFDLEANQSYGAEVDGGDIDVVFEGGTPPTPGTSNVGGGISIEEVNLKMIQTYPNPATESLNISGIEGVFNELAIYSLDGKLQLLKKDFNAQSVINIEGLSPGVYFIHLNNEEGEFVGKFNVK